MKKIFTVFLLLTCVFASHVVAAELMLPFTGGEIWRMDQGNYDDPGNYMGWFCYFDEDGDNDVSCTYESNGQCVSSDPDCEWQWSNPTHRDGTNLKYAWDFNYGYGDDDLGKPVLAPAKGTVVYAQNSNSGWGNVVIIDYDDGPFGKLAHLQNIYVAVNDQIWRGQTIGTCGGTGGWIPHIHYQTQSNDNINGPSIESKFIDVVKNYGVPLEGESYMSANHYTSTTTFRVGWYVDGWKDAYYLPTTGFVPYSVIFSTAYYQNGGNDVLGVPQSYVHEEALVDFSGAHPYVQDFQKYVPGVGLKTYTLIMNPNVTNLEYGMKGVVFPVNGQLRNYWYFNFYELGYPICNEYYWPNPETGPYVVQWFQPTNGIKTYVAYYSGSFFRSYDITIPIDEDLFEQHIITNVGCDGECGVGGAVDPPIDPPSGGYEVNKSKLCKDVNYMLSDPCEDPFTSIEREEDFFYHYFKFNYVTTTLNIEYELIDPNMNVIYETSTTSSDLHVRKIFNISDIIHEGAYRVYGYANGSLESIRSFDIIVANPPVEPDYIFSGSFISESWSYGSTDPGAPNYWDLQPVNPRTEFLTGDTVSILSKVTDIKVDHRWKTEFFMNDAFVWQDESGWLSVGSGWSYSSAVPDYNNVPAGDGEVKVWLDTGSGYQLLAQKYFTVVDNSAPFVYAGSQTCEGWENGSTDPTVPDYWDLQAVNPGDSFSEGSRVYLLAQVEDVSQSHEWKMEVFHGGVFQWGHLSGWLDLNGGFWAYSNFPPYIDNVSAGTYELKVSLRTDGDFEYLGNSIFNVNASPIGVIPFSADFELHDYGFYLEDNTGVGDGSIIRTVDSDRNCLELSNSGQADASWKLQGKKVGFDFVSSIPYNGSIWIKGETAGTIYVAVEKNTDPWTNLGMWKAVNITTTWQEYDLDFTFAGGVDPADVRLTIQFGNYQGKFWIDDVNFN